jgi:acetyl esterase/lipase
MSRRSRLINLFLRAFEKPHLARVREPMRLRRSFERKARLFFHGPRGSRYEPGHLAGIETLRVTGPGAGERGGAILYLHGGAYVMGSPRTHRAMLARLSQLTGRVAHLPDYRLAPEHAFPAAVEDAVAAYRALAQEVGAGRIVIGGDSAGGGLVLALLGIICADGLAQPAGTFAFSPLTDMTFAGASMQANARADVMLPAARVRDLEALYLRGADPRDPRASPLRAGFRGAAPVWLSAGNTEILLDDTRRMARHLRHEGVAVQEVIARDLPHVWPMFLPVLPEAEATLEDLAAWINSLETS